MPFLCSTRAKVRPPIPAPTIVIMDDSASLDINTGSYIMCIGSNVNSQTGPMQMSGARENWQPWAMPALLIATAARLLARLHDARFRDIGISVGQLPVLVALKDGASLSQKQLTRLAGVEQPSMAQLLA